MCSLHFTHPPAVQCPGIRYRSLVLLVKSNDWIILVHGSMAKYKQKALCLYLCASMNFGRVYTILKLIHEKIILCST